MTTTDATEKRYQAYFVEWDRFEEAYVFDRDIFVERGVEHEGWDTFAEVMEWAATERARTGGMDSFKLYDLWANDDMLVFDGLMDAESDLLALIEPKYQAPNA
jgi:hypothetical protein